MVITSTVGIGAFSVPAANHNFPNGSRLLAAMNNYTGVIFPCSKYKLTDIVDGTSNTYFAGEKYLTVDNYTNGLDWGDDQGWDAGFDSDDNTRFTYYAASDPNGSYTPHRDRSGLSLNYAFGTPIPRCSTWCSATARCIASASTSIPKCIAGSAIARTSRRS